MREAAREVVIKTAEYISSLPDGYNTTIALAVKAARPEYREPWYYEEMTGIAFEIQEEVEKRGVHLDYSAHENMIEGLPQALDFYVRRKGEIS